MALRVQQRQRGNRHGPYHIRDYNLGGVEHAAKPKRWRSLPGAISAVTLTLAGLSELVVLVWQGITASGNPTHWQCR